MHFPQQVYRARCQTLILTSEGGKKKKVTETHKKPVSQTVELKLFSQHSSVAPHAALTVSCQTASLLTKIKIDETLVRGEAAVS